MHDLGAGALSEAPCGFRRFDACDDGLVVKGNQLEAGS
jgi:hypothetical protein